MDEPFDTEDPGRDVARRAEELLHRGGSLDKLTPEGFLERIVAAINSTPEPDDELIGWIGCGDLENLIRDYGVELWPRVEKLARKDRRFRRALRSVWAYDSREFQRREALLEELGEFRRTWIRFVVEPQDFSAEPELSWRAIELEGSVPKPQLAALLRSIADWCERESR